MKTPSNLDGPCGGKPDYWVYLWIQVVALVLLGRELSVRARISAWSDLLRGGRSDVQLTDPGATQNGLPLRGGKGQH